MEPNASGYDVFSAKMTVDTQAGAEYFSGVSNCVSCQCQCHLCRGRAPASEAIFSQISAEKALETLLAA